MNSKTILAFLAFSLLFFVNQNYAQVKGTSKIYLQMQMQNVTLEDPTLNANNFFDRQASKMGLASAREMEWTKTFTGENGYQHFRYQQVYQSIPVYGAAYTIHQKNGIATHASGYYLPLIDLNVNPNIDAKKAIQAAMHKMDATTYAMEDPLNRSEAELVIIDRAFPQSSEYYALAYRVELSSIEPFDKQAYFIDANSGIVLLDLPLLLHQGVPAQGVTKYYGTQSITVDSLSPTNFLLQDPTRNGNATLNGNLEVWSNPSNVWDFTNEEQDEVAIDAHFCTQEFYDFMLEKLNLDGLNNEGLPMNIVVHAGDFVNAFWNGEYAAFGDGDCNHGPLTTLEVVAHEFMHGITEYTSNLVYSSESGAINESMSDIFGKALEFYTTPDDFDWLLGASFIETPYAESFRSFEDPNSREHPKFYNGEFWEDGGGVHTNSSVGNHWFFNMVTGGSGVNEVGEPYNIEALGMDKAIQIVFLTQKAYLIPNSTYQFYYESSLLATQELYGENSSELQSVMEAWKVVGFSGGGEDALDLAVSFSDRFINVCLNNQFFSTEVTITNTGPLSYTPNVNDNLSISGPDGIQDFPLTQNLLSGESTVIQINDIIYFDSDASELIFADLEILDDNSSNNSSLIFVTNSLYADNDLELLPVQFSDINCINNLYEVGFLVQNSACNDIAAGTEFEIRMENSTTGFSWNEMYTLPNDLARDRWVRFDEVLDLESSEDYVARLIFASDVNLENNEDLLSFTVVNPILEAYDNTMESEDGFLQSIGFFGSDYLDYGGNNVLAVSSFSQASNNVLCLDAADNIESASFGKFATFFVCADLVDMDNPTLGFDLTQFRNSEVIDFPELEDNSTIFKASWTSIDDSFEQIVTGQNEGTSTHYDLSLPAQFKGRIQFDFFHSSGNVSADDYFENDVSLFDNLTINEELVSTKNINSLPIKIQPNPSTGLLTITHPGIPKKLVLRSMQGQVLLELNQTDNLDQLDLSALPDSYYFLTIGYGDLGQVTRGVVKMSE